MKLELGIPFGIAAFLVGISLLVFATRPTVYESYNNAIEQCMTLTDKSQYEACIVAVNSGYARMTNDEKCKVRYNNK